MDIRNAPAHLSHRSAAAGEMADAAVVVRGELAVLLGGVRLGQLVHVRVVAEVRSVGIGFVHASARGRDPAELQDQDRGEQTDEELSHGSIPPEAVISVAF